MGWLALAVATASRRLVEIFAAPVAQSIIKLSIWHRGSMRKRHGRELRNHQLPTGGRGAITNIGSGFHKGIQFDCS
jgi:hypothetical protein